MGKLLIISGPTATGKTHLAANIAQKIKGELVSADSRQLYKYMDIGTGKDRPTGVVIHLLDIIEPSCPFSVAQYQRLAFDKVREVLDKKRLPIVVGGTPQYIDAFINPVKETFSVKPSWPLRRLLNIMPLRLLQKILMSLDPESYKSLNRSDENNPRRLIRKIELKLFHHPSTVIEFPKYDIFHINLTAPNNVIYERIDRRVAERLKSGLMAEIKNLKNIYSWADPGMNTLAYKEFKEYFRDPSFQKLNAAIERWKYDEHAYFRRQKTFFRKIPSDVVIDVTDPQKIRTINNKVLEWYNKP
ncbi:MAG: tRNA (adenosine(37)-N6)-dimethylallyltransferase MiaA [Patescibacteria group bacterium]|jgi:tRNA dimethylallyltransferase